MLNIVPLQARLTEQLWEKIITEYCHRVYEGWYRMKHLDWADP